MTASRGTWVTGTEASGAGGSGAGTGAGAGAAGCGAGVGGAKAVWPGRISGVRPGMDTGAAGTAGAGTATGGTGGGQAAGAAQGAQAVLVLPQLLQDRSQPPCSRSVTCT